MGDRLREWWRELPGRLRTARAETPGWLRAARAKVLDQMQGWRAALPDRLSEWRDRLEEWLPDRVHEWVRDERAVPLALGVLFGLFTLPGWFSAIAGLESPVTAVVVAALGALYVIGCVLAVPLTIASARPVWESLGLALFVGGWVLVLLLGAAHSWVLLYVLAVGAVLLPVVAVAVVTGVTLAVLVVWSLFAGDLTVQFANLLILGAITAAMVLMRFLIDANVELQRADEEVAALAVAGERGRAARDLQDILGHSLTTIVLKAGLARRILENSSEAPRAAAEAADVESLSRRALTDVRAAVAEHQHVLLSGELAGAATALRAAGIDADLPHAVEEVDPELQEVFGLVLREAVGDVLRHSQADRVRVRLGPRWIEVSDDGAVEERPSSAADHGFRELHEDLEEMQGRLTAEGAVSGFTVRAEVPPQTPGATPEPEPTPDPESGEQGEGSGA